MRNKGVGKVAYIRCRSPTVAIEVCLMFNFVVVIVSMYFHVHQVNQKLKGDVLINRQNAATRCMVFFYNAHCLINAPNHPALVSNARRTEKKTMK
jgi:hypothetical protein